MSGSARLCNILKAWYPTIAVKMKLPTNDKIEPALWRVPIIVKIAPAISRNGPMNSHPNHRINLPMTSRFHGEVLPKNPARSATNPRINRPPQKSHPQ